MPRFFHFADLHLGRVFHGDSLLEDQADLIEQILSIVRAEEPDAVILAGDIFDRSVPPVGAVTLFDSFLTGLAETGTAVIAIPGNHDSPDRLAYGSSAWESMNVHFRTGYTHLDEAIRISGSDCQFDIFAIPFVERSILKAALADRLADLPVQEESLPSDKPALMALATGLIRKAIHPDRPAVLVAHEFVAGSTEAGSERLYVGGSPSVASEVFSGFEYVALGHIHGPQSAGADNIRYAGSPMAYDFSETGSPRGFIDIRLDSSQLYPEITFRPLNPLRPLAILEDSLDNLLHSSEYADFGAHYVSARINDGLSHLNLIGRLRERFPCLREIRQIALDATDTGRSGNRAAEETPRTVFADFLDRAGWEPGADRNVAEGFLSEALDATGSDS